MEAEEGRRGMEEWEVIERGRGDGGQRERRGAEKGRGEVEKE